VEHSLELTMIFSVHVCVVSDGPRRRKSGGGYLQVKLW